jgi:hypothetical protein
VCQWLFHLESADFLDDEVPAEVAAVAVFKEDTAAPEHAPVATQEPVDPTVSLYVIVGILMENAMLLSVSIHGHHLVALLDSGSMHNFINVELMRPLRLSTASHPTMWVLVANGDRVPYVGVTCDVALAIGAEEFNISCFGHQPW